MVAFKPARSALGLVLISTLLISTVARPQVISENHATVRSTPMAAAGTPPTNPTTMAAPSPSPVGGQWRPHFPDVVVSVFKKITVLCMPNGQPTTANVPGTPLASSMTGVTSISTRQPGSAVQTRESSLSTEEMLLTSSVSTGPITPQSPPEVTSSSRDATSPRTSTILRPTGGFSSLSAMSSLSTASRASAKSRLTSNVLGSSASTTSTPLALHGSLTKSSSGVVSATSSTSSSRTSSSSSLPSSSSRVVRLSSTSRTLTSSASSRAPSPSSNGRLSKSGVSSGVASSPTSMASSSFRSRHSTSSSSTSKASHSSGAHGSSSSLTSMASSLSESHHATSSASTRKAPSSTTISSSTPPTSSAAAVVPPAVALRRHRSGPKDYYPAQLSQHPDHGRRRYVYTMAYAVASSATAKMLIDLGAMEECADLTWCSSAIWSWINFAAQQAVTRSNIAADEIAGTVVDDVSLAELALEGSSRSSLFMMQKTYKLVTGMRRLPEYGNVDWEDVLPREELATQAINGQLRVLQQGPVVEHAEVLKAMETAKFEAPAPLPTPQAALNPWDEGAPGPSSMRNLLLGLDDSPAESLRSLSQGPPEDPYPYPGGPGPGPSRPNAPNAPSPLNDPSPPGGGPNLPSGPLPPSAPNPPGAPNPPNDPSPPSDPDPPGDPEPPPPGTPVPPQIPPPPVGIDPTRISRITRVLNKLGSKFSRILQSIKDMFQKASSPPGKPQPKPSSKPPGSRPRPPTRDPLRPQPNTKPATKRAPKVKSIPKRINPNNPLDDFQRGNPRARGFNTANLPSAPNRITLNKPSRGGIQITSGSSPRPLHPNEPLFQETFDSSRGNLAPSNVRPAAPDDKSWDEGTVEAANLAFLQDMGLIEILDPALFGGEAVGVWVMASEALRPVSLDKGKASARLIEDAADGCAGGGGRRRGCGGGDPAVKMRGGMASLVMEGEGEGAVGGPIRDTLGQPLVSTTVDGADGGGQQRMLGVRAGADGVYRILKASGGIDYAAGRLAFDAGGTGTTLQWLSSPYNHHGGAQPSKNPKPNTNSHHHAPTTTNPPTSPPSSHLHCPWTSHHLRPYEVWTNPLLPPGCSPPTFYECTTSWSTYTACTFPQNHHACKKLQHHNPASHCSTNASSSSLTPHYLNDLGPKTSQQNCVWDRTLESGMVWSNRNMAPGCTRPVPWECTEDWERWFYGKGARRGARPKYCFEESPGVGHWEAVDKGCGVGFEGVGCRGQFLG